MKNDNTLHAAEFIDADLLNEAEAYQGKQKPQPWIKWAAAAACLALVIAAAAAILPKAPDPDAGQGTTEATAPIVPGGALERPRDDPESDVQFAEEFTLTHYDSSLDDIDMDMAVNSGCFELSNSLKAAIHEHGSIKYRVMVVVFKGGVAIGSGSDEVFNEDARLQKEGYDVRHETDRVSIPERDYIILHATAEQLLNFSVNETYGYFITFYDEYFGLDEIGEEDPEAADRPDERLQEIPDELAEAMKAISNAMARGDLPYVIDAAVYENPLRIEIRVNTTDQSLIDGFLSEYDPTGSNKLTIVQD